jgi:hypothetical protein
VSAAVPKSPAASRRSEILTTTSIVSFSLTLLAGGAAVLAGLVPLGQLSFGERTDIGTLLFVSPLVALVLAVVFEVTRIALTAPKLPEPRRRQVVRWSPGRGEG